MTGTFSLCYKKKKTQSKFYFKLLGNFPLSCFDLTVTKDRNKEAGQIVWEQKYKRVR